MCGRYVIYGPAGRLMDAFELVEMPSVSDRYNVAPQTDVLVIRFRPGVGRVAEMMRWGLVPSWAKEASIGARMINARAETVTSKPAFRSAFRRWRCIVPASGFYEWHAAPSGGRKQPYYVYPIERPYFGMAGLMERWQGPEGVLQTCTILTRAANELMSAIHERMPCILAPGDYERWLDPKLSELAELESMLQRCEAACIAMRPVSPTCGNVRNNGPVLIEAIELAEFGAHTRGFSEQARTMLEMGKDQ